MDVEISQMIQLYELSPFDITEHQIPSLSASFHFNRIFYYQFTVNDIFTGLCLSQQFNVFMFNSIFCFLQLK